MFIRTIIRSTETLIALALCLLAGIASAEKAAATAFREACAQKAAAAGDAMTIAGADGWLFLVNELRHVGVGRFWGDRAVAVSQATKPQDADPLPAILDFKRQLDALGIELILIPVPPKVIIYPDKVADTVAAPADGTRACFEPSWGNIGQLKLAFDGNGKVDQDKSEYKPYGGGCFPSMAPDNSYRVFRLEGDHKAISMCDADGANPRPVDVTGALTAEQKTKGHNTWITRWSTDPRYITLMAPAGDDAQIHMGRLDEGAAKFEAWVRVSAEKGPQCWQSHAWIEPARSPSR